MLLDHFDVLERDTCLRINAWSRHPPVCGFFGRVSRQGDYPAWVIVGLVCAACPGIDATEFLAHAALTAVAGILVYKWLKDYLAHHPWLALPE